MSRFFFRLPLVIFLLCFTASSVVAADSTYIVDEVAAEAVGKSPSLAKTAAINAGRRDAFLILLGRLGLAVKTADNISDEEIFEMVGSEQVQNEKSSGSRYSATLNIVFSRDFVDHILQKKSQSGQIVYSKNSKSEPEEIDVMIPVKIVGKKAALGYVLWQEENDWKKAISANIKSGQKKKFVVPDADAASIAAVNSDNVKTANYAMLQPMMQRYKADAVYVVFFSQEENRVNVDVAYMRKMQQKQIRLSFVNADKLSNKELLDRVAHQTIEHLLGDDAFSKNSSMLTIYINIPVKSLEDWVESKRRLEESKIFTQITVESISRDNVLIKASYPDSVTDISAALLDIGINLNKESENLYATQK